MHGDIWNSLLQDTAGTECGIQEKGDVLMDSRSFITGQDSPFERNLNLQASASHNHLA